MNNKLVSRDPYTTPVSGPIDQRTQQRLMSNGSNRRTQASRRCIDSARKFQFEKKNMARHNGVCRVYSREEILNFVNQLD